MSRNEDDGDHTLYPMAPEYVVLEKKERYLKNIQEFILTYNRYGTLKFKGDPCEELRTMATNVLKDTCNYMGADRLPISDHFAIVPNYYVRFAYRSKNVKPDTKTDVVYTVGFELVMRDYRSYLAEMENAGSPELRGYHRMLETETGPAGIGRRIRGLDIPVGMITKAEYKPKNMELKLKVKGTSGETYVISVIHDEYIEPVIGGLYDEYIDDMTDDLTGEVKLLN